MTFTHPELLGLLVFVPVVAVWTILYWRRRQAREAHWVGRPLQNRLRRGGPPRPPWFLAVLAASVVGSLVVALARPRWGTVEEQVERRGVDVVLVLDTSLSMAAPDAPPNRFSVAQALARRLLQGLPGNRFGLVQAEGIGTVLLPLTEDAAAVELLLDVLEPGSAPLPGTLLAPALERALELFPQEGTRNRVIVVLSDGEDQGSPVAGVRQRLVDAGVQVHTLGIGTVRGAPIPLPASAGEVKRDASGGVVVTRLVESTLQELSTATGGLYLRASSPGADLTSVVEAIRNLRGQVRTLELRTVGEERFQIPLSLGVLAILIWLWLGSNRLVRARRKHPSPAIAILTFGGLLSALSPLPGAEPAPDDRSAAASSPSWAERLTYNARERTGRGLRALETGDPASALGPFEAAARLLPGDDRTVYNRETSRLLAGVAPRLEALEEVARSAPGSLAVHAWFNLGNAQLAAGELREAIRAYREALLRDSDYLPAKHNLEVALRKLEAQQREEPGSSPPPAPDSEPQPAPAPEAGQPEESKPEDRGPARSAGSFQPQPDLNAEQAASLLAATEQLERKARKEAQARESRKRPSGVRDW